MHLLHEAIVEHDNNEEDEYLLSWKDKPFVFTKHTYTY